MLGAMFHFYHFPFSHSTSLLPSFSRMDYISFYFSSQLQYFIFSKNLNNIFILIPQYIFQSANMALTRLPLLNCLRDLFQRIQRKSFFPFEIRHRGANGKLWMELFTVCFQALCFQIDLCFDFHRSNPFASIKNKIHFTEATIARVVINTQILKRFKLLAYILFRQRIPEFLK